MEESMLRWRILLPQNMYTVLEFFLNIMIVH